ncbi:MAG: DegT/DnrJ/EryC1/StrS family aminotransferase [Myxococcota bacterium]
MGASKRFVALAKPCFSREEEQALTEVVRSGWVTQGPKVAEFEERFAAAVGADNAVAVSSATTALFLSLHALGIGAGDEVVVPSLTFIASVNPIVHVGATPVFADVDPRTFNLDPDAFEAALTSRTRAVMLVHQLGLPADLDEIQRRATARGVAIIEDSACALGSTYKGRPIGSSRHLNCFSFHPRKVIVTGEGGMMTTPDAALAARLRRLRHQGMSISDVERHKADKIVTETYPEIGFNFRMSDLHAAVGLVQLDKLDSFVARRRAIAARYDQTLAELPDIVTPHVPDFAHPNFQSYIARLKRGDSGVRDALLDAMFRRGVATRRGLMAVHKEASYANVQTAGSLEHTEAADAQSFVLPIYPDLSDDDQQYVIDALCEAVSEVVPA